MEVSFIGVADDLVGFAVRDTFYLASFLALPIGLSSSTFF